MKRTYDEEAKNLARAIDIAIESVQKYPPKEFQTAHVEHFVTVYSDIKNSALNPEPQFKNMSSLKYLVEEVFTYFQESKGEEVEYFWKNIQGENLPFERENKLLKILKKGKIKSQAEYDYIIDVIVPFQQSGIIVGSQVERLNQFIADFEQRQKSA